MAAEPTCEKCWAGRHARCENRGTCGCITCGGRGFTPASTASVLVQPSKPRETAPRKPRGSSGTRKTFTPTSGRPSPLPGRAAHRPRGSGRTYPVEVVREAIALRDRGMSWTQLATHFDLPSYEGIRWAVIHYFEEERKANAATA